MWLLEAKPIHAYNFWWPIVLSIEAGIPITLVFEFCFKKWSANLATSVNVWDAPTITKPSKFSY